MSDIKYKRIPLNFIFAMDEAGGIGFSETLPWGNITEDMRFFKSVTKLDNCKNIVIMGSTTYRSLRRESGLPGRINIVMSRRMVDEFCTAKNVQVKWYSNNTSQLFFCKDYESLALLVSNLIDTSTKYNVVAIGGASIYYDGLLNDGSPALTIDNDVLPDSYCPFSSDPLEDKHRFYINDVYVTTIRGKYPCDTFVGSTFKGSKEKHDLVRIFAKTGNDPIIKKFEIFRKRANISKTTLFFIKIGEFIIKKFFDKDLHEQ